jgi:Bacterial dnaA protein helix-turn-helix
MSATLPESGMLVRMNNAAPAVTGSGVETELCGAGAPHENGRANPFSQIRLLPSMPEVCPMNTPTISAIQTAVADGFGVTLLDLLSRRGARAIARPRQVAMWLCRHTTLASLPEIGRAFGGRDHTTVMHAIARVDELMAADAAFADQVRHCVSLTGAVA